MSEETHKPKVIVIAAVGKNLELGKDNALLWHLHEDMRFFKETTMGHTVVTGRKSFE
ncbi:MAG: dihydrofolate reductase, partial [Flavobacteriales bacterium]